MTFYISNIKNAFQVKEHNMKANTGGNIEPFILWSAVSYKRLELNESICLSPMLNGIFTQNNLVEWYS